MLVTREQLVQILPESEEVASFFIDSLNEMFADRQIWSPVRMAAFLAQAGHESVRFTVLSETLNYSVKGLLRVFPNLFTVEEALLYAHQPAMIANRIYANKYGNGDEKSEDGWRFRGRGLFPNVMVGKVIYEAFGRELLSDSQMFLLEPWQIARPEWACLNAGWIWTKLNLNALADKNDEEHFKKLTRRINTGMHGLSDRIQLWLKAKEILKGNTAKAA
jgi:putative chitinase